MRYVAQQAVNMDQIIARQQLSVTWERVHSNSSKVLENERLCSQVENRRKQLENNNPEFANTGVGLKAAYLFSIAALLAVLGLDFFLINALAHYLVAMSFGEEATLIQNIARIAVPVFIILLESAIALQILFAKQQRSGIVTMNKRAYYGFVFLGVMVAVLSAMAFVATNIADMVDADPEERFVTMWLMLVGAFMAIAAHCLIVFGGKLMSDAHGCLAFMLKRSNLERKERKYQSRSKRATRLAEAGENRLQEQILQYNMLCGGTYQCFPFPQDIQQFLNERFGFDDLGGHVLVQKEQVA